MTESEQIKAMKQSMDLFYAGERSGKVAAYSHAIACLMHVQSGESDVKTALEILHESYERERNHERQ